MLLKVYREELLLRIMTNLLDNSRKYRNKDIGHCVVSVSREENRAQIEFAGDGPGVDYECLGKLFDIFYRTDKARSNTGTGSGIGLAFVRKAVTHLMDRHYSLVFHGIIGIVIAATAMIIPFGSFASGIKSCRYNLSRSRNSGRSSARQVQQKVRLRQRLILFPNITSAAGSFYTLCG